MKYIWIVFRQSDPTYQQRNSTLNRKTNVLMLFRVINIFFFIFEKHEISTDVFSGLNGGFLMVRAEYIYTHTHTYIYIYLYTHTHTHTHTHKHSALIWPSLPFCNKFRNEWSPISTHLLWLRDAHTDSTFRTICTLWCFKFEKCRKLHC